MEEEPQSPLSSETDAEEQRNSNNRHELEAMVDIQPITLSTLAQVMPMAFDWLEANEDQEEQKQEVLNQHHIVT